MNCLEVQKLIRRTMESIPKKTNKNLLPCTVYMICSQLSVLYIRNIRSIHNYFSLFKPMDGAAFRCCSYMSGALGTLLHWKNLRTLWWWHPVFGTPYHWRFTWPLSLIVLHLFWQAYSSVVMTSIFLPLSIWIKSLCVLFSDGQGWH